MADASEDNLRGHVGPTEDDDISDETQDFRFLADLISTTTTSAVLKRGEKDFEPNPTEHQATLLAASRHAMHTALSYPRTHNPRNLVEGVWHSDERLCRVDKPSGPHFMKMGTTRKGIMWLLPEEMLYLLERGSLDVRWGDDMGGAEGLPMTVQAAYAMVLGEGPGQMSTEHWVVWSGLKRSGYIVLKNASISTPSTLQEEQRCSSKGAVGQNFYSHVFWGLFGILKRREDPTPMGPLVKPGLYRSYNDIYRSLQLVGASSPYASESQNPTTSQAAPPFQIYFNVYKPTPGFRKSAPGPPDFRIAVVDARTTPTPTLAQLSALMHSTPFAPPPEHMAKQNAQKLRHGYRNVVLAVVDQGIVSYLRLSESAFAEVKLYERGAGAARGGKGGRPRGKKGGRGGR
ncbi:MAG: tRNA-splicing endonuclease subunit sen54 [Vezdaea aestivalis]|nr:MAG: tRNA-splicing endonuclease subunit sen54 [Vezdaea aestivalis]